MAMLRSNWPAGLAEPDAVQAAIDEICRHFILSETMTHPVIVEQAIGLAYLLSAYGLAPNEMERAAAQSRYSGRSPHEVAAENPRHSKVADMLW